MNARLLLLAALLTIGFVTFAADRKLNDKLYAPILTYYADCSYVATNGGLAEVARIVSMLQRSEKPHFGLLDFSGKKVYEAIASTQGVILHPDPGIFGFGLPLMEYGFKTTPVEIVGTGDDAVRILVKRESTRPMIQFVLPVGPEGHLQSRSETFSKPSAASDDVRAEGNRVFVFTEIDEWIRLGGVWRLKAVRTYLV